MSRTLWKVDFVILSSYFINLSPANLFHYCSIIVWVIIIRIRLLKKRKWCYGLCCISYASFSSKDQWITLPKDVAFFYLSRMLVSILIHCLNFIRPALISLNIFTSTFFENILNIFYILLKKLIIFVRRIYFTPLTSF